MGTLKNAAGILRRVALARSVEDALWEALSTIEVEGVSEHTAFDIVMKALAKDRSPGAAAFLALDPAAQKKVFHKEFYEFNAANRF